MISCVGECANLFHPLWAYAWVSLWNDYLFISPLKCRANLIILVKCEVIGVYLVNLLSNNFTRYWNWRKKWCIHTSIGQFYWRHYYHRFWELLKMYLWNIKWVNFTKISRCCTFFFYYIITSKSVHCNISVY
jgi:hypothetical protein